MLVVNAILWGFLMVAAAHESQWFVSGVFAIFMLGNCISAALQLVKEETEE